MEMIDRNNKKLSISRKTKPLSINRTNLYYRHVPISDEEYMIKHIIDEVYTKHPEFGYRRMTIILKRDYGIITNRKRTCRYMQEMCIHSFCSCSIYMVKYLYPYLLRGLNIDYPNQVWSIDDITYCRIKRGFMYLIAIIDWYST